MPLILYSVAFPVFGFGHLALSQSPLQPNPLHFFMKPSGDVVSGPYITLALSLAANWDVLPFPVLDTFSPACSQNLAHPALLQDTNARGIKTIAVIWGLVGWVVSIHGNLDVVVQLLSRVWLSVTPWTAAPQASLSFTISQSLLILVSTESMIPSNHLILRRPPSPPALNLSQHQALFQSGLNKRIRVYVKMEVNLEKPTAA